jgi:hypothetical protein
LELLLFWELGKTNNFPMSLFPTIITKEILERNVALTSFIGMIVIIVTKGRLGAAKCTAFDALPTP